MTHPAAWVEGAGETVVLLHGTGPGNSALLTWAEVVPRLRGHCRVVTVDLPGFGASEALDGASLLDVATAVAATLEGLGVDRFRLAGHSLGGTVSAYLTMLIGERVRSLLLAGSGSLTPDGNLDPDGQVSRALLGLVEYDIGTGLDGLSRAWRDAAMPATGLAALTTGRLASIHAELSRNGGRVPLYRRDEEDYRRLVAFLGSTQVPITLLWGLHDRVAPARRAIALMEMLSWRAEPRLHVVSPHGHMLPLECPDLVVEHILGSVAGTVDSSR